MSATLRSGRDLAAAGLIGTGDAAAIDAVGARYSIAVPGPLAALIDRNDPADPIARQFVPDVSELADDPGELDDPIGDGAHSPVRGLVHRYPDRVLLMPTLACPVYCRYCFRRDRVGRSAEAPRPADIDAALDYIRARPEIREAILTGGDPLSLSDARLDALLGALDEIPHLVDIRIHTRAPVATPERVTGRFVATLQRTTPVWVALHCNHPRELTPAVAAACDRLTRGGIPLVSQTVLLRGVNDDADVLAALMRGLLALKVKPYYLHHPDKARGTARFRLGLDEGRRLAEALSDRVSGLARPTYVLDIPGGFGKVPVLSDRVRRDGDGWIAIDRTGEAHRYSD